MAGDLSRLPLQPTRLIGRDGEVAACTALVADGPRLLTLVGPPGVGKTRLALAVAERVAESFAHGAALVELAPLTDPARVPVTLAARLGVREGAGRPLAEQLADAIGDADLVLVLDNFEHLLDAAPLVADLLRACRGLRVLATSRAPLGLRWEHRVPVAPLPGAAARDLFVERARAVAPDFAVTAETAPQIDRILARLDGLPLAIELAAGRLAVWSPSQLAEQLGRGLDAFAIGGRDLPPHQRTVRTAVAWSAHLLDAPTRALFRRLAIFAGGWTLDAAEAVCGGDGEAPAALDGLATLVEQSLVQRRSGADGEPRFGMLETVREYALEDLQNSGAAEEAARRHARHFLALAEASENPIFGALVRCSADRSIPVSVGRRPWLQRIEADQENLRAAMTGAWATGDGETALRLAGALYPYWIMRGLASEGRAWLARALGGEAAPPTARAKALTGAGFLAWVQGDYDAAHDHLAASGELWRELGDTPRLCLAVGGLALVALSRGDAGLARALAEEGMRLGGEHPESGWRGFALMVLGFAAAARRDDGVAEASFLESAAVFRRFGDDMQRAVVLEGLGLLAYRRGDLGAARAAFEQTLAAHRSEGEPWNLAEVLNLLGELAQRAGQPDRAATCYGESLTLYRSVGDRAGLALVIHHLGALAHDRGRPEQAARLFGAAEGLRAATTPWSLAEPIDLERDVTAVRTVLGEVAFAAAWDGGRALPHDAAIALALEQVTATEVTPPRSAVKPGGRDRQESPAHLTSRQVEVLRLLAAGKSNREIAATLVVSVRTVDHHIANIYRKIGASLSPHARVEAAAYALRHGLPCQHTENC